MKVSDLIGQKLIQVDTPWDADLEEDQARLVFEGGVLMVSAIDSSGMGGGSVYLDVTDGPSLPDPVLIRRLETSGSGANNHTRGKVLCYYREGAKPKRLAALDKLIREAFATDNWKPLCEYMKGWW